MRRRVLLVSIAASVLGLAVVRPSQALNPQPEVPSKNQRQTNPKALNPQPEVPSKDAKKKKKAKKQEMKKTPQQP